MTLKKKGFLFFLNPNPFQINLTFISNKFKKKKQFKNSSNWLRKFRSTHQRCSIKKVFIKISQNYRKTPVPEACKFIKNETLAQVFSLEFCEIFKKFLTRLLLEVIVICRSSLLYMMYFHSNYIRRKGRFY